MDTKKITHEVSVASALADRLVNDSAGIIVVEDAGRHINCGDFVQFRSNDEHVIEDQVFRVKDAYAGVGMLPGWKVLFVKYDHANEGNDSALF